MTRVLSVLILAASLAGCGRGQPLKAPNIKETNDINSFIDGIRNGPDGVEIAGWALIDKAGTAGSEIFVILKRDGSQVMFPTTRVTRPDVSQHFGDPRLDDSGFMATIKKNAVKAGEYGLDLYITLGSRQALQSTGKTVKVD